MTQNVRQEAAPLTATQLVEARVAAGYRTQAALADALGVAKRTIVNWERDGVPLKMNRRVRDLLLPDDGPGPEVLQSLGEYSDYDLLFEIGRRLHSRHVDPAEATTVGGPIRTVDGDEPDNNPVSAEGRISGRGPRQP